MAIRKKKMRKVPGSTTRNGGGSPSPPTPIRGGSRTGGKPMFEPDPDERRRNLQKMGIDLPKTEKEKMQEKANDTPQQGGTVEKVNKARRWLMKNWILTAGVLIGIYLIFNR